MVYFRLKRLFICICLIFFIFFSTFSVLNAEENKIEVDLELILAIDVSSSVDEIEYQMQMQGIANAFRHPDVISAMRSSGSKGMAVALIQWSDNREQAFAVDWRHIQNQAESINFSREILYTPRKILGGQTSVAGAITFALGELASNKYIGTRKVIDISGDGRANTGVHPMSVRDMAIENGVTINALTILNEEPFLDEYYEYSVIGGQGSFVMVAEDYTDFATAIFQKLLREIGLPLAYKSKPYNGENTIFSSVIFK